MQRFHILFNPNISIMLIPKSPSQEDIELFDQNQTILKQNIKEFELKDKKLQLKERREGFSILTTTKKKNRSGVVTLIIIIYIGLGFQSQETSAAPANLAQQFLLQHQPNDDFSNGNPSSSSPPPPPSSSSSSSQQRDPFEIFDEIDNANRDFLDANKTDANDNNNDGFEEFDFESEMREEKNK
jgi:hypothetical protein